MKNQVSRSTLLRAVKLIKQWHDFPFIKPDENTFRIYYEKAPEMKEIRDVLGAYDQMKDDIIEVKSIPANR